MEVEVTRKRFNVDDYHRMAKAGILDRGPRVELIDGEIIEMSPIGHRHSVCVTRANALFVQAFGNRGVIRPQLPLQLTDWTEPQPGVVVFKPRSDYYAGKKPAPKDVLFLVEVSDTTLSFARRVKLPGYAAASIQEVWIEDLPHDVLHVYREPGTQSYKTVLKFRPSDVVSPLAFPEIEFRVDELLSTDCEL
jgi:Uma2 family endonuclease